jgi:hypothetical protein
MLSAMLKSKRDPQKNQRRLSYALNDVKRLQRALEAASVDLDDIEQRARFSTSGRTDNLVHKGTHGMERCVDHFAIALKKEIAMKRAAPEIKAAANIAKSSCSTSGK